MSSSNTAITWFDANAEYLKDRYTAERSNSPFVQQLRADLTGQSYDILDIGAGTGPVAQMLAQDGHRVLAVEPSAKMRQLGAEAYGTMFDYLDDQLPDLPKTQAQHRQFDAVTEIAVYMFMDKTDRQIGFRTVAALLRPGGRFYNIMKLDADEPERGSFPVALEEPLAFAEDNGLQVVRHAPGSDVLGRPVNWHGFVFQKPHI